MIMQAFKYDNDLTLLFKITKINMKNNIFSIHLYTTWACSHNALKAHFLISSSMDSTRFLKIIGFSDRLLVSSDRLQRLRTV